MPHPNFRNDFLNCDTVLLCRYTRTMQQLGGGGGTAGFGVNSPVFVPSAGLGAVDAGGMLGDIDAGFKVPCTGVCRVMGDA